LNRFRAFETLAIESETLTIEFGKFGKTRPENQGRTLIAASDVTAESAECAERKD
jgi:hypothetical protein